MSLTCPQCQRRCKSLSGLRRHQNSVHQDHPGLSVPAIELCRIYHPNLNGQRCDQHGVPIPPNVPPEVPTVKTNDNWAPFSSRVGFELAEFVFTDAKLSQRRINRLLELWTAMLVPHGDSPPITNHRDLHQQIDAIKLDSVQWESTYLKYSDPLPEATRLPEWKTTTYEVWYRNPRKIIKSIFSRPDLDGHMDYAAYQEFSGEQWLFSNVMSGNWAWTQSDVIAQDPSTHGSMFVPIILGSDKTTVSVATGQTEFHPVYLSVGNVQNHVRRAHKEALVLVGFLPISKGARKDVDCEEFRSFKRDLISRSIATILLALKPFMKTPDIILCPDRYLRRAIYGLGPHIADYPEQVSLAWVLFGWCPTCLAHPDSLDTPCRHRSAAHTNMLLDLHDDETLRKSYGIASGAMPYTSYFPRADIFEQITPDLLHQVIKGVYKDHLVDWVCKYLEYVHGAAGGACVIDEIDRRIALAPPFPGLRRFKQGRNFNQWTGDDSKALMKVYMNAIQAFVPPKVVQSFAAFLEFCYIARRNIITEDSLERLQVALHKFHEARQVFAGTARPNGPSAFSLPRQHAMVHYYDHIKNFGAPNGLCSSITESKHIAAVKHPWRRSNRHAALSQMLKYNERLDKLAAARADFTARGMLVDSCLSQAIENTQITTDSDIDETSDTDSDSPHETHLFYRNRTGDCDLNTAAFNSNNRDDSEIDDSEVDTPNGSSTHGTDNYHTPSCPPSPMPLDAEDDEDCGPVDSSGPLMNEVRLVSKKAPTRDYPASFDGLGLKIGQHNLLQLTRRFLFYQLNPTSTIEPDQLTLTECPMIWDSKVRVYHSATATFRAPSNLSGPGGMYREVIRSTSFWPRGDVPGPRRDCVFVDMGDSEDTGMKGFLIARVYLFFRFSYNGVNYPCALVHWYLTSGLDPDTGLWIVEPESTRQGGRHMSVVHIDSIVRGAHLLPRFPSDAPVYREINYANALDVYTSFYVNKYVDYHVFELAF